MIQDDTYEEIVMAKMAELLRQAATLSQLSAGELSKMRSEIKQNIDAFLSGLVKSTER